MGVTIFILSWTLHPNINWYFLTDNIPTHKNGVESTHETSHKNSGILKGLFKRWYTQLQLFKVSERFCKVEFVAIIRKKHV